LARTNTPAYYENSTYGRKKFYNIGPDGITGQRLMFVILSKKITKNVTFKTLHLLKNKCRFGIVNFNAIFDVCFTKHKVFKLYLLLLAKKGQDPTGFSILITAVKSFIVLDQRVFAIT
jgi:hypothetical protein